MTLGLTPWVPLLFWPLNELQRGSAGTCIQEALNKCSIYHFCFQSGSAPGSPPPPTVFALSPHGWEGVCMPTRCSVNVERGGVPSVEWCLAITTATLADRALTTPLTDGETEAPSSKRLAWCRVVGGKAEGSPGSGGGSTVLSCLALRQGSSHGAMLSPSGHWAVSGDMTWVVATTGGAPGIDGVGPGICSAPQRPGLPHR